MEKKEWLQGQSSTPTQVFFWGSDKNGLLGPEKKPAMYPKPQFLNFGVKIDFLACGDEHVAFVADGYLYTMGDNPDGRLGIAKNVKATSSPCLVEILKKSYIIKVACGAKHSAALTDLGEVFTWGCGENGQLGLKNTQNQQIPQYVRLTHHESKTRNEMPEPAFDISCGSKHTAVVTKPGDVFMFGSNEFGQLGNGGTQDELSPVKISVSLQKMQNVACGKHHTLLLTVQGNIYAFGQNSSGELGIGNKQDTNVPCRSLIPEDTKIFKISAGYHSAAISIKGELYVWGESTLGNYTVPRKIAVNNGSEIVAVQMGDSFTALLDRKGHLWNFGHNSTGELGQGDLENHNSIVQVSSLNSVKIKAFCCGKKFGVALADYPSGVKSIKEGQGSAEAKMKKQSLKQNGRRVNDHSDNKEEEEEEKSYDYSNENVEMLESDAEASSDAYQNIPKQNIHGITDSNNKIILELAGQYTSSGRIRDDPMSTMKGGVRNFETNMDTETDELREESHTFSTQNQITDSKYEDIWNTHDKEDRIRNILVDIKILRLQNALLEQQLEERSQQIANFRRKMREMAFTGRRTQEREQKMKELVLKLEAQSLKLREEGLKNSEELMRKETEIQKLKRAVEEKNGAMDSLVKDNNNLRELVHHLMELRWQEKEVTLKDREIYYTLENRVQQMLEDLNFAPATGYFSNTQVTETHKTETIHDSYKPREGSIDHQTSLASNSPKSTSHTRGHQKAGPNLNDKYSASFPSRRMSPASKEMYISSHLHDKERDKPISTGVGTHHAEVVSTAPEEPRISTRVSYAETRAKHQKTHTKSQCSLNLISLISPKNGNTHSTEPMQKVLASAKQTKTDMPVTYHKKKLSEPLLNFRPIPNVIEERHHKDMVRNYFKTLHPTNEKRISTSKDSKNSHSYFQNHLSTPAKDATRKMGTTQVSPFNTTTNPNCVKDKRKPESSQIYRKLLLQHFPAKISSTNGTLRTGGRTVSNAGKQLLK